MNRTDPTWAQIVAPLIQKCEVAAAMEMEACWNAQGASALGRILKQMAEIIDAEIAHRATQEG